MTLGDGRVLVAAKQPVVSDPKTNTTAPAEIATGFPATLPGAVDGTGLQDGSAFLAGGANTDGTGSGAGLRYHPASAPPWWTVTTDPAKRHSASLTLLNDGSVLVAGGTDDYGYLQTTELYDPTTNTWSEGPRLAKPHGHPAAVALRSGQVLVVGGTYTNSLAATTTFTFQRVLPGRRSGSRCVAPSKAKERAKDAELHDRVAGARAPRRRGPRAVLSRC